MYAPHTLYFVFSYLFFNFLFALSCSHHRHRHCQLTGLVRIHDSLSVIVRSRYFDCCRIIGKLASKNQVNRAFAYTRDSFMRDEPLVAKLPALRGFAIPRKQVHTRNGASFVIISFFTYLIHERDPTSIVSNQNRERYSRNSQSID